MSEWGWVLLGYGVAVGAVALYAWSVVARSRRVRRRLEAMGVEETR